MNNFVNSRKPQVAPRPVSRNMIVRNGRRIVRPVTKPNLSVNRPPVATTRPATVQPQQVRGRVVNSTSVINRAPVVRQAPVVRSAVSRSVNQPVQPVVNGAANQVVASAPVVAAPAADAVKGGGVTSATVNHVVNRNAPTNRVVNRTVNRPRKKGGCRFCP